MSDAVQLSLTPVAALPVKVRAAGPVGRPSPYGPVLDQIREQGPGQAYRITAEPLPLVPNKAGQIANRIRNGHLAGTVGGEFKATDEDGHVFVEYVGQAGADEYAAKAPERAERAAKRAANKVTAAPTSEPEADDVEPTSNGVTAEFATAGADTSGW